MNYRSNIIKITLTCILLIWSMGLVLAQPDNGGPTNPTPFGFVELLIGAGALYGGRKAYLAQKDKDSD